MLGQGRPVVLECILIAHALMLALLRPVKAHECGQLSHLSPVIRTSSETNWQVPQRGQTNSSQSDQACYFISVTVYFMLVYFMSAA